ncbi:MAG: MBL fold metallo-hydrolase, partial [Bacteroidota bacterium]
MDQRVLFLSLSLLSLFWGCNSTKAIKVEGPGVAITSLSKKTFIHVSYLEFQGGKVACNGLIYVNKGKAIVFDTPNTNEDAQTLIRLIETQLQAKVEAVVINHFHIDCLGGLAAFHEAGATSYANQRTIELAMKDWEVLPKNGFEGYCEIEISGKKVINEFIGKGHTNDNIISYNPDEKVMFGGSMIKS